MNPKTLKHLPIFRMVHVDNLEFLIRNGLWAELSQIHDPEFKTIGNPSVISRRTYKEVGINPPGGVLGEFIPFYFAGHSPMLLNIATGYNVPLIPQRNIIFLVCDAIELINDGLAWCYTDGNAASSITSFYNTLFNIDTLDWNTIKSTFWNNSLDDMDRMRKKASEFLVREHIETRYIKTIIVRNVLASEKVKVILENNGCNIPVAIDTKNDYYYNSLP